MKTRFLSFLLAISVLGICNATNPPSKEKDMEKTFKKISIKELQDNAVKLIGDDWMLITAGNKDKMNTMTASWGNLGFLWNKPVATIYVRPQRYTHEFIDNNEYFTLTFFAQDYRKALQLLGTVSGRDKDKIKEAGLTPYFTEGKELPAFKEARIILECKKIYKDKINPEGILEKDLIGKLYPKVDFHTIYIGEIVNVWIESK